MAPSAGVTTPETYLGAARAERFTNPTLSPGTARLRRPAGAAGEDEFAYRGRWRIALDSATAEAGAALDLDFGARRVYLVLGSAGGRSRRMRVLLDGQPIPAAVAGADVHGGVVDDRRAAPLRPRRPARVERTSSTLVPEAGGERLRLHLRLARGGSAAELAGDHHLLDLVGALADREDLGVAVEAADRVLLDVAVAAVDLDRLLGRPDREAAGDQLRLGGGQGERLAGVLLQRGAPGRAAGRPRSGPRGRRSSPGSPGTWRSPGRRPGAPWRRRSPRRGRPGRGRRPSRRRRSGRRRGCGGSS